MPVVLCGRGADATSGSALEVIRLKVARFGQRNRFHDVEILSCYVRAKAVQELVNAISSQVRVRRVRLAFDFSELFTQGASNLARELEAVKNRLAKAGMEFHWRPLRPSSGALVHCKGVCIRTGKGKLGSSKCLLAVGSANATSPGLGTASSSNVELLQLSSAVREVSSFVQVFDGLWETESVDPSAAIEKDQDELFRFGLLSSGRFLSKWSGNLRSLLTLKFALTDEGKRLIATRDRGLTSREFAVEQDSLSRLYVRLPEQSVSRNSPLHSRASTRSKPAWGDGVQGPRGTSWTRRWALTLVALRRKSQGLPQRDEAGRSVEASEEAPQVPSWPGPSTFRKGPRR